MEQVTVEVEPQTQQPPGNGSPIIFKKAISPVTLKFEDVDYKIKSKTREFLKKSKSEEKTILRGATGMVLPGEILAMLGPSGSGKTTLLTALGGRLDGHLEGNITYNGKPFSSTMKRNIGFVTQDDVMYPHLTVTETLVYTALLRLPSSLCKKEKVIITDAVITQLGLSHCRDSVVGNPFMRGVSEGERRRVSIGQEVIINPSILLLDEPTSGLDSTTAQRIVSTLWELANGGRTIVMTIHQPSSRLFYMFHKVLLLSEGNPLYYGKGSNAMDYFLGIQFAPTVAMNPSDFLLDLANGVSTDDSQEDQASIKHLLVSAYKANLAQSVKAELECDGHFHGGTEDKNVKQWPSSWWEQFSVLFRRGLKERKHESLSGLKIVEILAVIVITGLLWWQSDISHLQDQVGLLFFYSEFWGYVPLFDAIFTFPQERMMLEKERSSGMYRLSSYFMARTLGDLPMELIFPTTFFSITYWMAGLKPTPGNFFSGLIINLFNVLVSQGLGLALGAAIMDQESAITIGTVIVMLFLLSSGYFVQHVPKYISWIKYLSITQYTYKLLLGSQYKPGETYPCGTNGTCLVEDFPSIKTLGLNGQAISLVALAIMLVVYRLIAYLALTRIGSS